MPRIRSALLGDAAVVSAMLARLMHARIQAEVGNEFVGLGEPLDATDGGHQSHGHDHVETWDRH